MSLALDLERELLEELRLIHTDERFSYPCATLAENAPLALIQLELETREAFIRKLLKRIGCESIPSKSHRRGGGR